MTLTRRVLEDPTYGPGYLPVVQDLRIHHVPFIPGAGLRCHRLVMRSLLTREEVSSPRYVPSNPGRGSHRLVMYSSPGTLVGAPPLLLLLYVRVHLLSCSCCMCGVPLFGHHEAMTWGPGL